MEFDLRNLVKYSSNAFIIAIPGTDLVDFSTLRSNKLRTKGYRAISRSGNMEILEINTGEALKKPDFRSPRRRSKALQLL